MIPKECKRLAEVDFPIAVVSMHSAQEKKIRHGLPSTLHLWWARRPLSACRAILMALLLPDPCDSYCTEEFKKRARNILPRVQGNACASDEDLRNELLRFIGDFANWDNAASPTYLEAARGLVRAAHGDEAPLVMDTFAGGGSIPLEAFRLGCDTFATDLNPVACLILKTMLEDIPRHGQALAEELRKVAKEIGKVAEGRLSKFYPQDSDGAIPITYLWSRTVICDSCGAEYPLVRSFWLCKKKKRKRAMRYLISRKKGKPAELNIEIFEPKNDAEVPPSTVNRAKAVCPCCNVVLPASRVRIQLSASEGGGDVKFDSTGKRTGGARLLAVVTLKEVSSGRHYRVANESDYLAVWKSHRALKERTQSGHLSPAPTEPLPLMTGTFNAPLYGMNTWGSLFTARQKLALLEFANTISSRKDEAVREVSALALSKLSELANSLCTWEPIAECPRHLFGRQAIPMMWDFAEGVLTGESSGSFQVCAENAASGAAAISIVGTTGTASVQIADACASPLPSDSADVWFIDPPYYFAVPYADLSDFFFVWLKRVLPNHPLLRDPFDPENTLTPKKQELCEMAHWDAKRYPNKDKEFFENGMKVAFTEGRRVLKTDGIASIVFAHKTTEGWEALLSGIVNGGWVVTGSWPIATEMASRLRARDSAALATSVHLICRPRPEDASVGDWSEVFRELPKKVGDWIERLQAEGIRGADLVFACIGPAMEVYSRYRRVEDAEGRNIPLGGDPTAAEPYKRGFLVYVWETVGRLALEQVLGTAEAQARNGGAGALEEDSRLTALFLWTLDTTDIPVGVSAEEGTAEEVDEENEEENEEEERPKKKKAGYTLIYDVARRFAQPLGIHLDKWEGRIIETHKGVVRLLPVAERAMQLFGDADAAAMSRRIEQDVKAQRNYAFAFMQDAGAAPEIKSRKSGKTEKKSGAKAESPKPQQVTTLDRVHAAMLLQAGGQTNGLRALLREEQQRGPDFVRLANALSALYPKDSEEKRLLDAMLLAVPRN
jgi:adenine-specific DNA methylase